MFEGDGVDRHDPERLSWMPTDKEFEALEHMADSNGPFGAMARVMVQSVYKEVSTFLPAALERWEKECRRYHHSVTDNSYAAIVRTWLRRAAALAEP